jgi:hypothetical protein
MSWQERLVAYTSERNLSFVIVAEGVGIEFADGCDAFWVLPGEVTSSVLVRETQPDVTWLIGEFERIDRLRSSVLHVIRHDLAARAIYLDRRYSGEWGVMAGCVSSSVSVGPSLTARAVGERDVYRLVADCYENTILGEPPDRPQIDRYLATDGHPPDERDWPDETPEIGLLNTLRSLLIASGLCKAVEDEANLASPEKLAEAAVPTGRLGRALMHLADRLPHVSANCDLTDRSITLDFDDREDGFRIPRRSRDLARRVRSLGLRAAADHLADDFLRLNSARRAVLDAVKSAASRLGWSVERKRPFFVGPGIPATWYLGRTRREVELPVGFVLTDLLRTASPEQAIRHLLASHNSFAEACVVALGDGDTPGKLPERDLATALPTRHPHLRPLDPATMAEMDQFADRTLAAYLRNERTIWDYRDSARFDPTRDTWATIADWMYLAEPLIGGEWPNPAAVLVLLDAGDPMGADRARYLLKRMEPDHEASGVEVELAWRFRHELPELALKWFGPQPFDQMPFAEHRARLGDPVARRYQLANEGFAIDDDQTWSERANPVMSGVQPDPDYRSRLRLKLMEWARTTWKWSPAEPLELQKALWLDLDEVADALGENEYLTNGLLCGDRIHFMFDEPGVFLSAEFLLAWSRLKPTRLLARIVATACTGEVLAEAERVARESVERKPALGARLGSTLETYRRWWADLQIPLAICWKRFQRTLPHHTAN